MSTPIFPPAVWLAGTNQNSVPANDNSHRLEALHRLVISKGITAQPASPSEGDVYIIPSGATGVQWSTFDADDIAIFTEGTWYAFGPVDGLVVNIAGTLEQYDGSTGWTEISGGGGGSVTSVNGDTGVVIVPVPIGIACSDETTALTTGTAKATFRMPFSMTLTAVRASVTTAPTGSVLTVDINENGVSILSTKITIDATEKTSTTAATPAVISDSSLSDDAEITIDIDTIGSTIAGSGLKVWLIGYPS